MSDTIEPFAVGPLNPAIANTYTSPVPPTLGTPREDLADIIYLIDPDETPFVSACGNKESEQIITQWNVQQLAIADVNAQPEGFRYAAQPVTPVVRLNNVCQIMVRAVTVSNTMRASNTVGGDEFDRQAILKGKELKRDLEFAITSGTVKATTSPRYLAGAQCWMSNGTMGPTGALPANGALGVPDGTTAPTHGTGQAMTLALVNSALQAAYVQGGNPSIAIMTPALKLEFSSLAQGGTGNPVVAQNIVTATDAAPVTMVGAVSVYLSDFGRLDLAPDRFSPSGFMFLMDPDYMELAPLPGRDMIFEEYAKTGDAADGAMIFEGTYRPTAPKAHAMIGDLT